MPIVRRFIHNAGRVVMRPVVRTAEELFSDTVRRFAASEKPSLIVNGNFYDVSSAGLIDVFAGNDPVPASETTPLGQVVSGGAVVTGSAAPLDFYLAFDASVPIDRSDFTKAFMSGKGDPPRKSCAFGGLGPLVIDGLPFGATNSYRVGAPAGSPVSGEPPPASKPFLVRRSSAKFRAFAERDARSGGMLGKTCIGVSPSEIMVFVQEDGTAGATIESVRDEFVAAGCRHAVFFDGSDSAMLFEPSKGFVVKQGPDKDESCTVGVALFWYP